MIQPDFFRRWNLWMCALGCLVWGGAPRAAFAQVTVTPTTSLSSMVQRNPPGTTYLITAGVHRLEQVTPRDGDKFIGEPGAILSGAKLLTSFAREGSYWAAAGQTQRGPISGQCDAQHPRCSYPEELYFDNAPLQHVAALKQVGPGKWFFDYAAQKIYLGDDPAGHVVETSVLGSAFTGSAQSVEIRGLIIEKYANTAPAGAVGDLSPGFGWTVQGNEIRLNHAVGVTLGGSAAATGNHLHHNGQWGLLATGGSVSVSGNEIDNNNIAGFSPEGGGAKFTKTTGLRVLTNNVHHNSGPGLWSTVDNLNALFDSNTVQNNSGSGISHDLSFASVISGNIVQFNGPAACSWLWGAQIQLVNSSNVEVRGNRVQVAATGCGNGIVLVQQNRGAGMYGVYATLNNWVHDNRRASGKCGGERRSRGLLHPESFRDLQQ